MPLGRAAPRVFKQQHTSAPPRQRHAKASHASTINGTAQGAVPNVTRMVLV
jgi:hypothetical protein